MINFTLGWESSVTNFLKKKNKVVVSTLVYFRPVVVNSPKFQLRGVTLSLRLTQKWQSEHKSNRDGGNKRTRRVLWAPESGAARVDGVRPPHVASVHGNLEERTTRENPLLSYWYSWNSVEFRRDVVKGFSFKGTYGHTPGKPDRGVDLLYRIALT